VQTFPINLVALAAAAVLRTVLGMVWFSPLAFGPTWIALVGCSEADMKRRLPRALVADVVGNFVMAFVLVHAVHYAGATSAGQGAAVGFFNWVGLVMVATLFSVTFEGRPFKLFAINNGFHALSLIAMGAILAVWV
jgi:uncharacterized protein DUF1761